MRNNIISVHTDDCLGGDECEPVEGEWMQPPGNYVNEAKDEFDDDAPWCQVRIRAWEIAIENGER